MLLVHGHWYAEKRCLTRQVKRDCAKARIPYFYVGYSHEMRLNHTVIVSLSAQCASWIDYRLLQH